MNIYLITVPKEQMNYQSGVHSGKSGNINSRLSTLKTTIENQPIAHGDKPEFIFRRLNNNFSDPGI